MIEKYLTIKEAAEYLGVTPLTLRNWDKNGKLPVGRHPVNNYRTYKLEKLTQLKNEINDGGYKRVSVRKSKHKKLKINYEEN